MMIKVIVLYQILIAMDVFILDWLNMIYPRLRVARDLLTDDGVVFISIDDNEVRNLKIFVMRYLVKLICKLHYFKCK